MSHAVKALLQYKRDMGRAESTIAAYEDRLRVIVGHVMQRPVRHLSGRGAELYAVAQEHAARARRSKSRPGGDTHRNALVVANMLGRFCVKHRWLKTNPFADVEPVGARLHGADKPQPTHDESRRLSAYCVDNAHDSDAVLTLAYLYLGVRCSEITSRNVRDLDDGGSLLWIRHAKTRAGDRRVVIPEPLSAMLARLAEGRQPDDPLFVRADGVRVSKWAAYRRVKAVCESAGLPNIGPQTLRRTNATLQVEANVSATAVAAHLGHASVGVARRSYIARGTLENTGNRRVLHVIQGGQR